MRRVVLAAALLLAGCATARGGPPESGRGFATEGTLGCATLVLEQRGYTVAYFARRRELRGEKAFSSGARDLVVHGILTARLEAAPDSRPVLRVSAERRFAAPAQDSRRGRSGPLRPSAYFVAGAVDEDAQTVLDQCTTATAPD
jgi:hypothetical protein